ncbi:MAG: M28 family peptidase [Victivallales bacterium]
MNGDDILARVSSFYNIGPKISGSENAAKAAEHIRQEITGFGLKPETDEWEQLNGEGIKTVYRNISVVIPGEKKDFIIIGSHYDTKRIDTVPDFAGANDGASSTGLLLSAVNSLKKSGVKPHYTLRFVFLDGEECLVDYTERDGLAGSRRLASRLKDSGMMSNCRAVIIMDMVGDKDLNISIPANSTPELTEKALAAAEKRKLAGFISKGNAAMTDDHVPFLDIGIPAIDIIDFEYGENNRYWHTGGDTLDKLSPSSLEISGKLLMDLAFSIK